MRAEGSMERALQAKLQTNQGEKIKWKKYKKKNFNTQEAAANSSNNNGDNKRFFP